MQKSGYRLVLVHGTFARSAPWTQNRSLLRSTLAENLDLPVTFSVFKWTGDNDHSSRLKAAEDLQNVLRQSVKNNPSESHFVIAHSHGGNVVLHALKDAHIRENIEGVVTMGTPFISCRNRELGPAIEFLIYAFPLAAIALVLTICVGFTVSYAEYFGHRYGKWAEGAAIFGPIFVGAVTCAQIVGQSFVLGRKGAQEWAVERQNQLSEHLNVKPFSHPAFLCAVVGGDEAGEWLSDLQLAGRMPGWLFFVFLTLWKKLRWMLLVLFVAGPVVSGITSSPLAAALSFLLIGFMFMGVALQLSMLVFPKVLRAHKYGFGGETFCDNWLSDIFVTETPLGIRAEIWRFEAPPNAESGLRHSAFFEDPHCLQVISRWIQTTHSGSRSTQLTPN